MTDGPYVGDVRDDRYIWDGRVWVDHRPSVDLAEFLLARIAEDEAMARAAAARNGATWLTDELHDGARITGTTEFGNPRSYRGDGELWDDEGALGMFAETAEHVARHDPARVLAECESKRRVVNLLGMHSGTAYAKSPAVDAALQCLALPYADHSDYQPEWKP